MVIYFYFIFVFAAISAEIASAGTRAAPVSTSRPDRSTPQQLTVNPSTSPSHGTDETRSNMLLLQPQVVIT